MKTKVNLNQNFITKAKAIHGEKYLYNLVKYRGSSKKVNIICQNHGVYSMSPSQHLSGKGCPYCEKNRLTRNDFMELMSALYGSRYDFAKCSYTHATGLNEYLTVTCMVHGDFRQKTSTLIKGKGCDKCAKEAKLKAKLNRKPNTVKEIEFLPDDGNAIITYPVVIQFKTLKSENKGFLWTEPFENKSDAEKFLAGLTLCIEMSDSLIIEASILEKKQEFLDIVNAAKLITWLNLESYEAYLLWWDTLKPSFIPRNLKDYYQGIDKYIGSNDVGIIISILNRIRLSDNDERQVA